MRVGKGFLQGRAERPRDKIVDRFVGDFEHQLAAEDRQRISTRSERELVATKSPG